MTHTKSSALPLPAKRLALGLALSLALSLAACDKMNQSNATNGQFEQVQALVETEAVASSDDAADDPAIWLNVKEPQNSRILGTDKKLGLAVYDIEGRELQMLERGQLINVDLRQQVMLGNKERSIAVATNRTNTSLDVFEIEDNGYAQWIMEQPLPFEDPYGLCMYKSTDGKLFVFANDKNGDYQQWHISAPRGPLKFELVREFSVNSQPEGCAADDATDTLYIGEEAVGIWQMAANPSLSTTMELVDHVNKGHLTADVEGMAVYRRDADTGYLVVSSQGDSSYSIYSLGGDHVYLGSFKVTDNPDARIDGAQDTDGLAVISAPVTERFPQGMLVVQDGVNKTPDANQNFKLVSWADIATRFGL